MNNEKEVLTRVRTPQGEVQLQRWITPGPEGGQIYEIIFNGVFLMASYNDSSSKAAASLAMEPLLNDRRRIRALVGGLGIGYTLRASLDCEGLVHVDVVEIEDHVIQWANTFFTDLHNHALSDPRAHVIHMDLTEYITKTDNTYDAIILDVDNGPTMLARAENEGLYQKPLMTKIRDMLTHGGVLTVWAEKECPVFMSRLEEIFDDTEIHTVQDTDWRGHFIDCVIYRARSFKYNGTEK